MPTSTALKQCQLTLSVTICLRDLPPARLGVEIVLGPIWGLSLIAEATTSFCTMRRAITRRRWLMVLISSGEYSNSSAARPAQQTPLSRNIKVQLSARQLWKLPSQVCKTSVFPAALARHCSQVCTFRVPSSCDQDCCLYMQHSEHLGWLLSPAT